MVSGQDFPMGFPDFPMGFPPWDSLDPTPPGRAHGSQSLLQEVGGIPGVSEIDGPAKSVTITKRVDVETL